MAALPDYLVVGLDEVLKPLRRLLTHPDLQFLNIDWVLTDMIEALDKPSFYTGRYLDEAVKYLLALHRLNELHVEQDDYDDFRICFTACLIHLRDTFESLKPYEAGRLAYRYKERRGLKSVILERYIPPRPRPRH